MPFACLLENSNPKSVQIKSMENLSVYHGGMLLALMLNIFAQLVDSEFVAQNFSIGSYVLFIVKIKDVPVNQC